MKTPQAAALEGTPEQVKKAKRIRTRVNLERLETSLREDAQARLKTWRPVEAVADIVQLPRICAKLRQVTDAAWWIEHNRRFGRSEDALVALWPFLRTQFGDDRCCGAPVLTLPSAPLPRVVRAAAALLRRLERRARPDAVKASALPGVPRDLGLLLTADALHVGLLWLGPLRWNVRPAGHAAEVLEMAGHPVPTAGELRSLASDAADGVHLLAHWLPGAPAAEVFEVDVTEERVSVGSLQGWLDAVLAAPEHAEQEGVVALRGLLGDQLGDLPQLSVEPIDPSVWEQAEPLPSPEVASKLRRGGHIRFLTAPDGTAVALHTKGIRYLNSKGAGKVVTFKERPIDRGTLNADGRYVRLYDGAAFHRVTLADGAVQSTPVTEYIPGYAHLPDDLVLLASPGLLRVMDIDASPWRELQRVETVDVPEIPSGLREAHAGRWVFVATSGDWEEPGTAVFAYEDGQVRLVGSLPVRVREIRTTGERTLALVSGTPCEVIGLPAGT